MENISGILRSYWQFDSFRPLQEDIIRSVLEGKDTLAILPTGGGKSICFQVPAMASDGLCLVVSPLIALMKDQVDNLRKRNIPALMIHSGMKRVDVIRTLKNATDSYFKFLYLAPERLETSLFLEYLPALHVNLIAIDEAHCISQWGYDFRPSYLRIQALRKELPGVPVLALTASATPEVQKDICVQLEFSSPAIFKQSFTRPNLSYSIFLSDTKPLRLVEILNKVAGSAIVYCKSRKRTLQIMQLLQLKGISAQNYHAGLSQEDRNTRQKDWIEDRTRVMVCTNAFGMGIDKPDVRLVIHADVPDCLENYYQEAGRAGRDGVKAYCVLLYNEEDRVQLREAHKERFPSVKSIREVYQDVHNFLQVPSGSGAGNSYDFDLEAFCRNFKRKPAPTLYALKALEQDGWFDFNEKSFAPSSVVFNVDKKHLYEFQEQHPTEEPLLTTLLRTYEGIFDFPAFISEKTIAILMRSSEESIAERLKILSSFGVIRYAPRNDAPQLILRKNRADANTLLFREAPYQKRREAFIRRTEEMIAYIDSTKCRSITISKYFGEDNAVPCGVCDVCLKQKQKPLQTSEFESISQQITAGLKQRPLTTAQLLSGMGAQKQEKFWEVLDFLQSEKIIEADADGKIRLRN